MMKSGMYLASPLLFASLACDDPVYDVETWQSPLASEFDGEPSVEDGASIYTDEHWGDSSSSSNLAQASARFPPSRSASASKKRENRNP